MTDKERAIYLIEKSCTASLTEAEDAEFQEWLISGANREEYVAIVTELLLQQQPGAYEPDYWQPVLNKVLESDRVHEVKVVSGRRRYWGYKTWMSAAAVLILVAVGMVYIVKRDGSATEPLHHSLSQIKPGHTGALLTLGNGQVISLDSIQDGVIATDNGTSIVMDDGQLVYEHPGSSSAVVYNTVMTPLGRQFEMSLPDGTKVWLNAGSSLRYPTVFSGKERKVMVTGEAYFEVAPRASMPFIADAGEYGVVEVLGTAFNINAYANEQQTATTLLTGSVKYRKGSQALTLRPGQQAVSGKSNVIHLNEKVNVAGTLAWKNGVFNFEDLPLDQVMRQLARWYDIEVEYAGAVPNIEFFGEMGKNLNLLQVLQVLEKSGVKFKIKDDKKLIVMP